MTIKSINGLASASIKSVNGLAKASVKNWNGLAFPSTATWVSDDFSGGTLDTSKWTSHITTSGTISVASSELQMTRPASGTYNYLDSVSTQNSQIIFVQGYLSWDTNSANEDIAGIMITSSSTPTHGGTGPTFCAHICSRTTAGGNYRLIAKNAGSVYDFETSVAKGKEVKITYNTSTNDIKYWYWNTSAWTQMGTTQNANILNGGNIKMIAQYDYIVTSLGTVHIDNLYFGRISADYSTQYPT